jgi:2'-5' RNA ligase
VSAIEPSSAVVVRVPLPLRLARLRAQRDWAASMGVPPHVTILYPFLPAARLAPAIRDVLAEVAAAVEPFDIRFERVGRFPGVVYLAPEPELPFSALTRAVHARFPNFPPYEGAFDVVIPHLTITESVELDADEAMLVAVATEAAADLPFATRIERLEVLAEGADGRWRGLWRIPFVTRQPL